MADGIVVADRVVALPRLQGPRIGGVPQTFEGFIPVDPHGRVTGVSRGPRRRRHHHVPRSAGGIAAQQADAAAEAIAAALGAGVKRAPVPAGAPWPPAHGKEPHYLRGDLASEAVRSSLASPEPLWWPPAKIVGRHLAPFLAGLAGTDSPACPTGVGPAGRGGARPELIERRRDRLIEAAVEEALLEPERTRSATSCRPDALVVAPEDTLGEVAERMGERDVGSAIVAEYGSLIGILTSRDMLRALAARVHSSEARVRIWTTAEPIDGLHRDRARGCRDPDDGAPNPPPAGRRRRATGGDGRHAGQSRTPRGPGSPSGLGLAS